MNVISEELRDELFESYSLSKKLIGVDFLKSVLSKPVLMNDNLPFSFAKHLQKSKHNRLSVRNSSDSSIVECCFIDSSFQLMFTSFSSSSLNKETELKWESLFQLEASYDSIREDPSIISLQSLLFISNGSGKLSILSRSNGSLPSSSVLFDGQLSKELKSFVLVGAQNGREENEFILFMKEIKDPSLNKKDFSSSLPNPINFVSNNSLEEKEEENKQEDKRENNQKDLQFDPQVSAKHNEETTFLLHIASFTLVVDDNGSKTMKLQSMDVLNGKKDFDEVVTIPSSHSFILIGSLPLIPSSGSSSLDLLEEKPVIKESNYQSKGEIDPKMLEMIRERLAPFTTDTEVNPYQNMEIEAHEDYDEFESIHTDPLFVWIYEKNKVAFEAQSRTSLEGIEFFSFLPPPNENEDSSFVGSLVGGYDVDLVILDLKAKEKSLEVGHRATFDGIGYIQSGKKQKRFLKVSPHLKGCAIVEFEQYIFYYQRKKASDHKSLHQLVELNKEEIVGFQLTDSQMMILTRGSFFLYQINP
eukprot:TRINITY_DN2353_c0_g1_i1.p1 TRINITY_DN2353_c0_g1~~TRINITY_DN2353_c0_g1_i1.p1  ORF type:complete len:529 (-),score=191.56 TRINITY_DN2353_c0_g1_i1:28-1614(-)